MKYRCQLFPGQQAGFPTPLLLALFLIANEACSANDGRNGGSGSGGDANRGGDAEGGSGGTLPDDENGGSGMAGQGGNLAGSGGNGTAGSNSGGSGGMNATEQGGRATGGSGGRAGGNSGSAGTPVSGILYAWDNFSAPVGAINGNFFDIGAGSGQGWESAWQQGEHSGPGYFAFSNATPLAFGNLKTSGNYLSHTKWDLGRVIDLAQPSVAPLVQNNLIAKAGTTVWLSVLVRLDSASVMQNADAVFVTLHHSGLGYHFYNGDAAWVAGAYRSNGVTTWSLWVAQGTDSPAPDRYQQMSMIVQAARKSAKIATVGKASLLVVKVEISGGASDKISLYADPVTLGGAAPATPDVTAMTGQSARFGAFAIAGGGDDDIVYPSSFDEVRIGPTFASVTPTQ